MTVTIILPSAINQELINKLQAKITAEFNLDSKATFEIKYHSSLILGYQLLIDNRVWDKSFSGIINNKLATIQAKL